LFTKNICIPNYKIYRGNFFERSLGVEPKSGKRVKKEKKYWKISDFKKEVEKCFGGWK
jgi:hypothetical protein